MIKIERLGNFELKYYNITSLALNSDVDFLYAIRKNKRR